MSSTAPIIAPAPTTATAAPKSRRFWDFLKLLSQLLYFQLDRTRLFTQAAALTYKTLFSLLPVFVLSLLILSAISTGQGKNALDTTVQRAIFQQLGLDKLYLTDNAGQILQNTDGSPVSFSSWVQPFLDRAKSSVTSKATGLIAFGVLLYGAISLMIVIEATFNHIYGAAEPRTLIRRIMLYWCVLTLGPIGIAGSILLGRLAYDAAHSYRALGWLLSLANALSGFLVSWLLIYLMYRIIPDARVKWRPAVVGSFIAAVAWEIGKFGFGMYVEHAVRNSWYGSLALLPLFMLWIYLTWSVILLGLLLTFTHQHWRTLKNTLPSWRTSRASSGLSDVRWILPLAVLLCERFRAGRPLEVYDAADRLALSPHVAQGLLTALEKAGLAHNVRSKSYVLARPPESITAFELLLAARTLLLAPSRHAPAPLPSPLASAAGSLDSLESSWARSRTLADLCIPEPSA